MGDVSNPQSIHNHLVDVYDKGSMLININKNKMD